MQHKSKAENRRSKVRVIARVDGEEEARGSKLRNWENERGRKFKKLKHKQLRSSGKPKGYAKNPPINTRRMATTQVVPPLRIKYSKKS